MVCSMAALASAPLPGSISPTSRQSARALRSSTSSVHQLPDPACNTSRMRRGASAAPRKKDEFSSSGTPTTATAQGGSVSMLKADAVIDVLAANPSSLYENGVRCHSFLVMPRGDSGDGDGGHA